jgi:hypothetical protein
MKRLLCKPTVPRLPSLRSHIRKFMRFLRGSFRHWRAAVVMVTCFADFLCFGEVINIRLEDLTLAGSDLRFRVRKAKNHRLGFDVCLPVGDPKSMGSTSSDVVLSGGRGKLVSSVASSRAAISGLSCPLATLHCTAAAKISLRQSAWIPSNTLRIQRREVQPRLQSWQALRMLRSQR